MAEYFVKSKSVIIKSEPIRLARTYKRQFRGDGSFAGQVLVAGVPKQATVEVYHTLSRTYIKSVESDVSGNFIITDLKRGESYDLIAVDPLLQWEKKVSSSRQPAWMEPEFTFTAESGTTASASIQVPNPRAWWRVYVTDTNGGSYIVCQEVEMLFRGVNQCHGGTPIASSQFDTGSWSMARAFDGDKTTSGQAWSSASSDIPGWIGYQFVDPVGDIDEVRITATAGSATNLAHSPQNFIIQSSRDGVTWVDEWTVTGQTDWTYGQERSFPRPP